MNVTAVIGLLGALVGGLVTGGVTLMRERLLAKREREARERAKSGSWRIAATPSSASRCWRCRKHYVNSPMHEMMTMSSDAGYTHDWLVEKIARK